MSIPVDLPAPRRVMGPLTLVPLAIAAAILLLHAFAAWADDASDARLAVAAMNRDMVAVRSLIRQGVDVNALGTYETPALHWVVRVEDLPTAGLLLDAGADPNLPNRHQVRPLHLAIANGDMDMVQLLLAAGADPNIPDRAGESALFMAARVGGGELVQVLLQHGAAVDERDPAYGQTPLMVAVREGHADISRLLIARGADVNAQTATGETPKFRRPEDNAGSKGVGIVRGGSPEHGERDPVPAQRRRCCTRPATATCRSRGCSSKPARSSKRPTRTASRRSSTPSSTRASSSGAARKRARSISRSRRI